jgi:hypothetical protein
MHTKNTASKQPRPFPNLAASALVNGITLHVFRTGVRRTGVFAGGRDAYGFLHHLMGGLHDFTVTACFGERLRLDQGTCFELDLGRDLSEDEFLLLRDRLLAQLQGFTLPTKLPTDLYAWLTINVPRDDKDLLPAAAALLAENKVNLSSFRFDRLEFRPEEFCVALQARMELPLGLDHVFLEEQFRQLLPADAFMPPLELSQDSPRLRLGAQRVNALCNEREVHLNSSPACQLLEGMKNHV